MGALDGKEITNAERIKRIIGILRLDGRELEVHFPHYIEIGIISDTTQEVFRIKIKNSLIDLTQEELQWVHITFVFSGVELIGKCRVISHSEATVTLDYPDALMSRTKRRFPRIKLSQSVSARLKLKQYPDKRGGAITAKDLPVKYSKLFWEVQRENVDIKKIFILVGGEIKKISPHSEIVLYNKDNIHSLDAQILRKSGQVLYVDNCRMIQSYTRFIPSDKIINYSYYINEERVRGTSKETLIEELKDIVRENLAQNYTSKALVPIFSKEEVIGHIKGVQKESGRKISYEDVADLMSLSALMAMGIERAGFVPDLGDIMQSSLIDISEGGLRLKVAGEYADVIEGADLEVKFVINGQDVSLKGTVARKDESDQSYAIQFTDVKAPTRQLIKKFIDESIENLAG
jgi:hypothetical protein